jgi:hypothetical protein
MGRNERKRKQVFQLSVPFLLIAYSLNLDSLAFLSEYFLMPLNIAGRYSHEKEEMTKILTKEHCNLLITRTEEFAKWIMEQSQ